MAINNTDMRVICAIQTLIEILANLGRIGLADYLRTVLAHYESGNPAFAQEIASAEMWGGAGSVADNLPPAGAPDRVRYYDAMIALADYMNERGIGSQNARKAAAWIADTFRQWRGAGL